MKYLKLISILIFILCTGIISCNEEDEGPSAIDNTLDLQTLEAETTHGTLQAKREENSYISSLGEGQAIGISYLNDITTGNHDAEQVAIHLYDGEKLAVLIGEVDSDGEGMLQAKEQSDFDATVELTIKDDTVTGTASFLGENTPFTAHKASGNSGIYWAEGTEENPEVSGYWVVLTDQRQWGCVCIPPHHLICCMLF